MAQPTVVAQTNGVRLYHPNGDEVAAATPLPVTSVAGGSVTADTELPAAALLADNAALPTTPIVGAALMGYDGTTLDLLRTKGTGWQGVALVRSSDGLEGTIGTTADAMVDQNTLYVQGKNMVYNGATWDRQRGNVESTVLASAARTTTTTSSDQTNYNGRALQVFVNVTAYTAGGLTPKIQFKDALGGSYVDVLTGAKLVATGLVMLTISPSMAAVANVVAQGHPPRTWRVVLTPDDATSITYSVGANTLV